MPEQSTPPLLGHWTRAGLDELLRRLRSAGIRIGAAETIDAVRLLTLLARQRPEIQDASALQSSLRAALCKSAKQQADFDPIYQRWLEEIRLTWKPEAASSPASVAPVLSTRRLRLVAIGLSFCIGVVVLLWILHQPEKQLPPVATTSPTTTTTPTLPSAPSSAPLAGDQIKIYGYAPIVQYHSELRPQWAWAALCPPTLLLLLLGLDTGSRLIGGARSRDVRERTSLDGWTRDAIVSQAVMRLSALTGGRLHRHVRGPPTELRRLERRPQIHLRRTVEATFRNLGLPTLRYREARLIPSYLVLVEAEDDESYELMWAERLLRERLNVDLRRIVMRDGEPRMVRRGASAEVPLSSLPNPAFGQRLIVVSSGAWAADDEGRGLPAFRSARFGRWPERVFFTPREPRRWGAREDAIELPERSGDHGFLLLPIDESALDAWSTLLASGRLPDIELESPQHFPRMIHELGETAMLGDSPPADLAGLIAQLKRYLGPNGFLWLCCCAVPPLLHRELTLSLGERFMRASGANDSDLPAFLARNYRLLLRLPWLHHRQMPAWLRVSLLASLSATVQREVRQAVQGLLAPLHPSATGSLELAFESPPTWGKTVKAGRRDAGDILYIGFLGGLSPAEIALRMPGEWQRWISALRPRRQGWRRWADRLAAARDRLRFRRGLQVLGVRRWPLWAIAGWLLMLAGAASFLGRKAPTHEPGLEHGAWLHERASRVELPHAGPLWRAVFSPDGTRVVTASRDHTARVWDAASGAPLGAPLKHDGSVYSAVFSPDGRRVVTASADNTARVWDAASGAPLGAPLKHDDSVHSAVFSPDGTRVVTASADHTARVWDAASGAPLGAPLKHDGWVNSAVFSPDGTRVVTASQDKTSRVWDATSGAPLGAPLKHDNSVWSAVFSPDGTRVVTASRDNTARVWDAASGAPLGAPLKHDDLIWSAVFSPDGTRVVTASRDNTARVWDAASGAPLGAPLKHDDSVHSAVFSPDGTRVVTASRDNTARVWDAASGAPLGAPLKHDGLVYSAVFSPDGRRVVTASRDGTARVWDAASGAPVGAPLKHDDSVWSAVFSPDGTRVVTASRDHTARVWDAASGAPLGAPLKHDGSVYSAVFSPDGRRVVTASADNTARVWDAASGAPLGAPLKHDGSVYSAVFSPDGRRVVTASADNTARVWDAASGAPLGAPLKHDDSVHSAVFSPDGTRVVTASADHTARVWDAASGAPLGAPLKHDGWVNSAVFSPDGTRVVTASQDKTSRVWDATSGAPLGAPLKHDNSVWSAVFSPDGTRVVTASRDNTARVWDAASGAPLGAPLKHDGLVYSAVFSPDGRRVVTASADGTARVWDARTAELLATAAQVKGDLYSASFSPDGSRIVIASGSSLTGNKSPAPEAAPVPQSPDPPRTERKSMAAPPRDRAVTAEATTHPSSLWTAWIPSATAAQEGQMVAIDAPQQRPKPSSTPLPRSSPSRTTRLASNAAYILPAPLTNSMLDRSDIGAVSGWLFSGAAYQVYRWGPGMLMLLAIAFGIRRARQTEAGLAVPAR